MTWSLKPIYITAVPSNILQPFPFLPLEIQSSFWCPDVSARCLMEVELLLPAHRPRFSCCLSIFVKGVSNHLHTAQPV